MKNFIVDSRIPFAVRRVIVLTVEHDGAYTYAHAPGRTTYTINFTRSGCMEYRFPDTGTVEWVTPGQAIYIPKGVRHTSTYTEQSTVVDAYHFDMDGELPLGLRCIRRMPEDIGGLYRLGDTARGVAGTMECTARIYTMLGRLLEDTAHTPQKYRRLLPALEAIEQDPAARHDIAHYADLCYMSESGFRRAFKAYTGQSPIEYRNALRLRAARALILCGEYSVEEAATHSGFTNLSFFYRLFRRTYGEKPGDL